MTKRLSVSAEKFFMFLGIIIFIGFFIWMYFSCPYNNSDWNGNYLSYLIFISMGGTIVCLFCFIIAFASWFFHYIFRKYEYKKAEGSPIKRPCQ